MTPGARLVGLAVALFFAADACTGKPPRSEDAEAIKETERITAKPATPARKVAPRPLRYECRTEAQDPIDTGYTFEVDGTPTDARITSLAGTPERPSSGDVISIAGPEMVLGPPGHYRYRSSAHGSTVELSVDGGPYRLVGAKIDGGLLARHQVDLTAFSPTELRGLRGLFLSSASEPAALHHLDRSEVAFSFVRDLDTLLFLNRPEPPPLSLPEGLRYLRLEASLSDAVAALRTLGPGELRYLVLELRGGASDETLDAREIAGFTSLEHLEVDGLSYEWTHLDAFGSLTGLRSLDLSGHQLLTSLEFVRGLHQLRRLDVRATGITSLEPLDGHPSLEVVVADQSPLVELPSVPPPSLRRLSIMMTSVEHGAASAFAQRARGARVDWRLAQALADVTSCATRVRVRTGGLCHRRPKSERTLFELSDPAAVREAIELITVAEEGSGFWCMCCGNPTIEFYRGEELVAEIGFHHGRSLRWSGWSGDALVADEVVDDLCRWMKRHGAEGACGDRDRAAASASTTE